MSEHKTGFFNRKRLAWYGVAAALIAAILAGFVIYREMTITRPDRPPTARQLASYLSREHRASFEGAARGSTFSVVELEGVADASREWVGRPVNVERLGEGSGLVFLGAGRDEVPGKGSSIHLRFETDGSAGEAGVPVSLWVQVYTAEPELEDGRTYTLAARPPARRGAPEVLVWKRGGLVYYLLAETEAARELAREAEGLPAPTGRMPG